MSLAPFKDLIFYEIYPNSFKDSDGDGFGDLKGIISKLDYVAGLGFNAIWLNPIYDSPFRDGGYDVRNFFKIAKRFGTMDDFDELIRKAHRRGIRVFMDLIPGHASIDNEHFIESGKSYDNEDSDLFIWNGNVWDLEPGYRLISGMYDRNGCFLVNFFAHQPAFNYGFNKISYPSWQKSYKEVTKARFYLEDIMKFWLDRGTDGFRVDMADSLVKDDPEKEGTIWLWQQIRSDLVKQGYREFYLVSEWSDPAKSLKAGFDSDFVLDHWTNFSHYLLRQRENGYSAPLLEKYNPELFVMFTADAARRVQAAQTAGRQISLISGNHDTWRLANFLSGPELVLAYLFILTMPGVPFIYYGDEIGMHTDTSMPSFEGGYQRTGSRLPMRFDSTKNAGFSTADALFLPTLESDPTVAGQEKDPDSLLNSIRRLISLRHEQKDLRGSDFAFLPGQMAYRRGSLIILINLLSQPQEFRLPGAFEPLLVLGRAVPGSAACKVAPSSGAVLKEKE